MSCKCDTINIVNDNNVIVVSHADGRDGKSAYQQAVEGGYTGTEQEFNCSLSLLADVKQVKENLVSAIEYKGGTSSADKSFQGIAEDIKEIPNFNTNGIEYVSEEYIPTTLLEAYESRFYIKRIVDKFSKKVITNQYRNLPYLQEVIITEVEDILEYAFLSCSSLRNVVAPKLRKIRGVQSFATCINLINIDFPQLIELTGNEAFVACRELKYVNLPEVNIITSKNCFTNCPLNNIVFGVLASIDNIFNNNKLDLRNITIGQGTNINLPFQNWTATNVVNEGQSGIDELNSNLRTNLLEKLADHSTDGETRTLRLGWLAHVTQENIDYANSKGWTLTT